jgi:predicted glycosyltransferase
VREHLPKTKLIWGLSDVIGDPDMIRRDWKREDFYRVLEQYCDEVWIYGAKEIFDQIRNYQIPAAVASKYHYIGYLRPPRATASGVHKDIVRLHHNKKPYVLITAGSGAQGFTLIDYYLRSLERAGDSLPYQSLIVTGPMMRTRDKFVLKERAQKLPGVIFHRFSKHVMQYVKHAHLVVSTGGYNTLCEILSYRKKAIFAPALVPPHEHMLRTEIFQKLGLVKRLHPKELTIDRLAEMIESGLFGSHELTAQPADVRIPLDGLDKIVERIELLGGLKVRALRQAV